MAAASIEPQVVEGRHDTAYTLTASFREYCSPRTHPQPAFKQDKAVAAASVSAPSQVVEGRHDIDVVPHVPSNYPHFTPFIENIDQVGANDTATAICLP